MKHHLLLLLLTLCLTANAQDSISTKNRNFSLDAGLTFDNYGWLNPDRQPLSTEYVGLKITPDWMFAPHWGLKLDLGATWAFRSNSTGIWEKPMHSITNVALSLSPYYEFNINRWFIDLGVQTGCRVRLPFMNGEMSRYLMTLSVSVGASFRFGYMFTNRLGIYADLKAERTVYDILYDAYYTSRNTPSGAISTSIGIIYRIYEY